VTIFQPQKLL